MRSSRLLEQTAVVAAYKWAGCVFWEVWVRRCEKQLWFLEINSPCLKKQWILFQDCTRTSFFVTVNIFVALPSVHLSGAGVLGKLRIKSSECYSTWKLLMKTGVKLYTAKHPEAPEHVLVGIGGRNPESATGVKCWTDCEGFFENSSNLFAGNGGEIVFWWCWRLQGRQDKNMAILGVSCRSVLGCFSPKWSRGSWLYTGLCWRFSVPLAFSRAALRQQF